MTPSDEPKVAAPPVEVRADDVIFAVAPESLGFETTDEVAVVPDWYGQERALGALELALSERDAGFNVYVCGLSGTRREDLLAELLRSFSEARPTPPDRIMVQNFADPHRPAAHLLPAGWGTRFRADMRALIGDVRDALAKTFRAERFEDERERLSSQFGEQGEAIRQKLIEQAAQAGFLLQFAPSGEILYVPMVDGRPMEPPELEALTPEQQADLRRRQRELNRDVNTVMRQQQALLAQLGHEVRAVERRVASEVISPLVEALASKYPHDGLRRYLDEARDHMLDHLGSFQEQPRAAMPMPMAMMMPEEEGLGVYDVNVLVDNGAQKGAPVIVENSPTYRNLFGAVERRVDRLGRVVTDFTRLVAGSILRAHGGCLVLNVQDALSEPFVWRALKRCLEHRVAEVEAYDLFAFFATPGLKPEPMPIDVRVVLTGAPEIFQALHFLDEEFSAIFKLRADFEQEIEGGAGRAPFVARIARIAREESLPPFTAAAVAAVLGFAARLVGDRRKLPTQWDLIADVMREAAFRARRASHARVDGEDVEAALEQRRFRMDRVETRIRELIRDQVLLVDVDGSRVGQVNGLAVANVGGYEFGRPTRITASVSMGALGVVSVDREAKMSGSTFDKGVLTLCGYLRHTYAQDFPLSLSASLSFEQSYSGVDGDSASAAEVFALVSSLSGLPLRQDIAVTGSVNQFGEIQPVGGVNEKVEGFFRVCQAVGLSGRQGVALPVQNLAHLVLDREVEEALRQGRFHLWALRTVDQGLELLTGVQAGDVASAGTVHGRAAARLRQLAEGLRQFGAPPPAEGRPAEPARAAAAPAAGEAVWSAAVPAALDGPPNQSGGDRRTPDELAPRTRAR